MSWLRVTEPMELSRYVRFRRRRSRILRWAGALLIALVFAAGRLFFPGKTAALRELLLRQSTVDRAVAAFYHTAEQSGDLSEAAEVFYETLRED